MQNTRLTAEAGDLVQLAGPRQITITVMLKPGARIESTYGILQHDELIGLSWGSQVSSHTGKSFVLLQPALDDLLRSIRRNTQIMYPKDIGYVLVSMGIGPSQKVIEAGTGSGALTIALAHAVGPEGRVYSYERRAETMKMARSNLEGLGLANQVSFKVRDIVEGFDERAMRAVYLDLPNPEDYLPQVQAALQPGGFFGCILPTANQVSLLIASLEKSGFAMLEVSEMLHRYYNTEAGRFRPADSMVAHTGYLVFARRLGAIPRKPRGRR
jgi:tRNA (adenine57-N1/adenine58-N1)-methyltransferase